MSAGPFPCAYNQMMEPLTRTLFKDPPDAPLPKCRVSDGETTLVMDFKAYQMSEEDLRYLFDMYREL